MKKKTILLLSFVFLLKNNSLLCLPFFNVNENLLNLNLLNESNKLNNYEKSFEICLNYSLLLLSCNFNHKKKKYNLEIINFKSEPLILLDYNDSNILICFKGTTNLLNALSVFDSNLSNKENKNDKLLIHNGLYKIYMQVEKQLIDRINVIIDNNEIENIYLTGFSLGGSLAILSSFRLKNIYKNINFFNYPLAPFKIGNEDFIKEYEKKKIKTNILCLENDFICKFPDKNLYKQINGNIFIIKKNMNKFLSHRPKYYLKYLKKMYKY